MSKTSGSSGSWQELFEVLREIGTMVADAWRSFHQRVHDNVHQYIQQVLPRVIHDALQQQLQDSVSHQIEEVVQQENKKAIQRTREAMRLQTQRSRESTQEVTQKIEAKIQRKNDTLHALQQKIHTSEAKMRVMERLLSSSAERERGGVEKKQELEDLKSRMQNLEVFVQKALHTVFPRVDDLVSQLEKQATPRASVQKTEVQISKFNGTSALSAAPSAIASSSSPTQTPSPGASAST